MHENGYIRFGGWGRDKRGLSGSVMFRRRKNNTYTRIVLNPIPYVIRFFSTESRYFCSNGRRLCDSLPAALHHTPAA